MYLIIEGMPASGKTTLAKSLAEKIGAVYFKSLLPNDEFGNLVRELRDSSDDTTTVNLLHIIDLYRNELTIKKLLDEGQSVVRDKCFISSLAHFLSVVGEMSDAVRKIARMAYEQIAINMIRPDAVVFLDHSQKESLQMCQMKNDKTAIDQLILGDKERFEIQHNYLKNSVERFFGDRLIVLNQQITVSEEISIISEKVGIS